MCGVPHEAAPASFSATHLGGSPVEIESPTPLIEF
jgi:hypothetical protein